MSSLACTNNVPRGSPSAPSNAGNTTTTGAGVTTTGGVGTTGTGVGGATTTAGVGTTTTVGNGGTTTTAGVGGATSTSVGGATSTTGIPWVEPVESIDLNEMPNGVVTVSIEADPGQLAALDQAPYSSEDVVGAFVDSNGTRYEGIDVNYRGAYQLRNLILEGDRRNWKLKFAKEQMYEGRREWNFNYEPHLRQKLAYDLMKFSGVKVPSARHVLLLVNGEEQGLYLQYEDPDNKDWLSDKFADNDGDLYKAATDVPGETALFATTEYLGDLDEDYVGHWQKKLNNNDAAATDYTRLREFLGPLNSTPSEELPAFIEANFDVEKFINYLVVANFISNWDSLPQRPKNFWLYEIPEAGGRWVFIPWDMDATFQVEKFMLNPMGTDASVFYQFDGYESYDANPGEGTERPLVRRIMEHQQYRDAYVAAYRQALTTYLDRDYLIGRVDSLQSLLSNYASFEDSELLVESSDEIREFINARHSAVSEQLNSL